MSERELPTTVGDIFNQRGPCVLMTKVVELAEKIGRIPIGEWDYLFTHDPAWRLIVNGGQVAEWHPDGAFMPVKRFEAAVECGGWLVASFNTVDGCVVWKTERDVIAAFDRELLAE